MQPDPAPGPLPVSESDEKPVVSLDEVELTRALAERLAGESARGLPGGRGARVVWTDWGDEVLVHLESTKVLVREGMLYLSIDLETDQTGRSPVAVVLALASQRGGPGLLAATEELPHGNELLVGRWGRIVQDAVWAALLDLARDFAATRLEVPVGLVAQEGSLSIYSAPPLRLTR